MIRFIKGNLLESDAQALVNTVNTAGVMGKGLALQFREHFPKNYREYREACKKGHLKIGQMFITEDSDLYGSKTIINFPTKTSWRKPSTYDYIYFGLKALREELVNRGIKSVAIPPLGSRNGGLDWNRVKKMIVDELSNLEDCDIIIYEPSDVIIDKMKEERVRLTPARAMMLDVIYDMINQGDFASEFAAEKIVYFLQRFGAENQFKLSFKPAQYGPYSGKVRYVLRYLNGSYLMGLEEMNQTPFQPIWIVPDAKEDVVEYMNLSENRDYKEISETTKQFLDGFYSSYSLELLSTIDYLLVNDTRLKDWRSNDDNYVMSILLEDISAWSNRKKQLFSEERYIKIMLNHLRTWQAI